MAWKYVKILYGRLGSTETNPYEINVLAGTTQCQVGGTIESDRAPMYSALTALIDGNLTSATYWGGGTAPTVTVTMPVERSDLSEIQMVDKAQHTRHVVWVSDDKIAWTECPYSTTINVGKTQIFGVPAVIAQTNFVMGATLNFNLIQTDEQIYTYTPEEGGGGGPGTPVNWINGANVSISNGTLTKISGGSAYNAGAKGDQLYENNDSVFFQVVIDSPKNVIFGFNESVEPDTQNDQIIYFFELRDTGSYFVWTLGEQNKTGTYSANDVFKVSTENGQIKFYINNVLVHTNTIQIFYPIYIDGAIYNQGESFTASINGGLEALESQAFEQTASLNISVTESTTQDYTAIGYSFDMEGSETISLPDTALQSFTEVGYSFEQTASLNFALTDAGTNEYTAIGYSNEQTAEETFSMVQSGALDYTAIGYNFEQSTDATIFINDLAYQWITMEGYDLQQSGLDNIYLLDSASQDYTARGYSFEQSDLEDLSFIQTASQTYTPIGYSREENALEDLALSQDGAQDYTPIGYDQEQATAQNISLFDSASQDYTAIGYNYEQATLEDLALVEGSLQDYTAIGYSRETSTLDYFGLLSSATSKLNNQGYSLEQIALNMIDLDITVNKIYTRSHTFLSNAMEDLALIITTNQDYFPIGYSREQTAQQNITIGSFGSQDFRANFEQTANEIFYIGFEAVQEYTAIGLNFEQSAIEIIDPLDVITAQSVIYSEGLHFETGFAIVPTLSLLTTTEKLFIPFGGYHFNMTASNPFSLNETAILIWDQGQEGHFNQRATTYLYLQEATTKIYEQNFLNFTTQTAQSFSLEFSASSDHRIIFASGAGESIELSESANSLYEQISLDFQANALEDFTLAIEAISDFTEAHIFEATASQTIEKVITAINQYQNINAYSKNAFDTFGLVSFANSEYQHINIFISEATDQINLIRSASFIITTEPRDHMASGSLLLRLNVWVQVRFESNIYKPTYAKEITKPNTLWEPLEKDRQMVELNKMPSQGADISDTIFSNTHNRYKEDRRIFNLIGEIEPSTVNYASESTKKDTLYTLTANDQLQLDERGLSID